MLLNTDQYLYLLPQIFEWCAPIAPMYSLEPVDTKQQDLFPRVTTHPLFPWKCSQSCGYKFFFFSWQQQYVSSSRLAQKAGWGGSCIIPTFSSRAIAWTTNWHPVSYTGVHAEAGPVPAEHLPGPVPAAAPQEGPHAAQIHRGRHVRAVINKTWIQITGKLSVWQ